MTLIKTNAAMDTNPDLSLQLTFEPEAAVLHSPDHPNMPSVRIAFSHADMEARFFPQGQLTPLHLERAIEWVEDHIQAAHPYLPQGAKLFTKEADLQTLAIVVVDNPFQVPTSTIVSGPVSPLMELRKTFSNLLSIHP
jgi:hypothetical protein